MGQDRAADLRERLVQELVTGGSLRSPSWVEAFRHVARHEFLPCFFRPTDAGGWEAIDDHHPEQLDLVYADATWVTQLERGQAALLTFTVAVPPPLIPMATDGAVARML